MDKDQPLLFLLLLLLLLHLSFSITVENNQCTTSCGEVTNISYPFRLKGDPKVCGDSKYELACINNHTILDTYFGKYYVRSINYTRYTIRVVDVGLQKGNCSSLPLHTWPYGVFHPTPSDWYSCIDDRALAIVVCTKAIDSPLYINTSSCLDGSQFLNFSSTKRRVYAMIYASVSSLETGCTIELIANTPLGVQFEYPYYPYSYAQIHENMSYGFELSWFSMACATHCKHNTGCSMFSDGQISCEYEEGEFRRGLKNIAHFLRMLSVRSLVGRLLPMLLDYGSAFTCKQFYLCEEPGPRVQVILLLFNIVFTCMVVKFILGAACVMLLLIRTWRRRHLAMDQNIEEFLQLNNNFLPIRYSYSDIKKITGGFKDKLGEGGYGFVFKGRLRSGCDVAVKILKKGKANGQDFINEVATIGRIHHVNVVGLIGYCFESSKQALVYNFMHNGSLDKHIFSRGEGTSLDCKEVHAISLGVAKGIEYLHRGCDVQILHFDIKPHNILLDKDFTPKVSDFGLARLYPIDYNTVALTNARGTLGYMAPELVYKNIGGISYKADVYSFGKLLIEMASGRKNWETVAECSSQTYFPLWVHNQLSQGLDVVVEKVSEEDRRIIKKMIIVALWCIQWNPSDRPSMRKVLKMLDGEVDDLQMPPKPLFYSSEMSLRDDRTWTDKGNDTISTSLASVITHEDSHLEDIGTSITQV